MFKKKGKKGSNADLPGGDMSISDVGAWLQSLGLGEYCGTFKKNKVDGVALLALTEDDLRDLGIGVIGHRKSFLTALAQLRQKYPGAPQPQSQPPGQGGPQQAARPQQQPVQTIGLVARNIDGKVRIFDTDTGEEVHDIAAHQRQKHMELAQRQQQMANGGAPPPQQQPPPQQDAAPDQPPPIGGPKPEADKPPIPSKSPLMMNDTPAAPRNLDSNEPPPPIPPKQLDDAPLPEPTNQAPIQTKVDSEAQKATYYYYGSDTNEPYRKLEGQPEGSFIVCSSPDDSICLTLHYVKNGSISAMRIEQTQDQLHLSDGDTRFPNLSQLIAFYAGDNPELPHLLVMPGSNTGGGALGDRSVWYFPDMGKETLVAQIEFEPNGAFAIRDSRSEKGCFALSYVYKGKVLHKLIEPTSSGLRFRLADKFFGSLEELVQHYAANSSSDIKCQLIPPRDPSVVKSTREAALQQKQAARMSKHGGTMEPWDCMHMSKDQALAQLQGKPPGTFVIRPSDKAYAALSMNGPSGQFHMHIESVAGGLRLKKASAGTHADLQALIAHYCTPAQAELPCPLSL
eukprot:m.28395 g.28395  ORF g.28395 m.28395 type:complete len:568 (+) comp14131_c0_seq1:36-1739(+)